MHGQQCQTSRPPRGFLRASALAAADFIGTSTDTSAKGDVSCGCVRREKAGYEIQQNPTGDRLTCRPIERAAPIPKLTPQHSNLTVQNSLPMPFRRFFPVFVFLLVVAVSDVAAQQLTVSRVIDGDTFELSDGRRVRLIGIDAPESRRSAKLNRDADRAEVDRDAVLALGIVATDYARMIAQDKAVELEFDQANAARDHADRYGRTVAYIWVLDGSGEQDYMVNRRPANLPTY